MLKKFCPWRGCKELIPIDQRYCEKHIKLYEQNQKNNQKDYDNNIRNGRDKKFHDFYNSKEWEQIKSIILSKYHGLCIYSYYILNEIVQADAVHHIEELKENWDKRVDIDNLIPVSSTIHNKIREMYKADKEGTQRLLRELKNKWDIDIRGRGI